jgi:hypothetical protein
MIQLHISSRLTLTVARSPKFQPKTRKTADRSDVGTTSIRSKQEQDEQRETLEAKLRTNKIVVFCLTAGQEDGKIIHI